MYWLKHITSIPAEYSPAKWKLVKEHSLRPYFASNNEGRQKMTKRILVIDDFAPARKSFILALEDTPYKVYTAESGAKGVELQKKLKFDLIFLDLNMPGMSGIETLREIRKNNRDVPVYIVTAFYKDYLDEIKNAIDDGIEFLVAHKPITPTQIVLIAKNMLEASISKEQIKEIESLKSECNRAKLAINEIT